MTALLCALLLGAPAAAPRTAVSATMVVKVTDRTKTADQLIDEVEKLGGYFASRTDAEVVLKVPVAEAKRLMALVEQAGKVIDRQFAAQDVGERLEELRTRLKSRQQVFERYFAVLAGANAQAVVEVEQAMTQLVQEIESLKGALRLLEHQLQLAQVVVRFEFRERRPPERSGSSSFAWLNTMNLVDLLREFGHEE